MHIRPIDLTDERETHAFYLALRAAILAENADRPMWSEKSMRGHLLEPAGEEAHGLGAFGDDGRLLGGSIIFYPLLDNLTMAFTEVFVAPEEQRRGVGSALVSDLLERVAAAGRTVVLAETTYGFERREDHPYRRFAEKHGFVQASTEVSRRLELPVDDGQIQAWIDEAAPHHTDYRIETFRNADVPDELLPSMCHVVNQLALDAPTGDIEFEAEQTTPEVWRQRRDREKREGLQRYETVAIDRAGNAVAVTNIGVPAENDGKAHQWATIVLEEHRGHRLGLAIKAHNLRALQRDHPERTSIHTSNSEVNGPMIDINERLGFKPVELLVEFQRKLDA